MAQCDGAVASARHRVREGAEKVFECESSGAVDGVVERLGCTERTRTAEWTEGTEGIDSLLRRRPELGLLDSLSLDAGDEFEFDVDGSGGLLLDDDGSDGFVERIARSFPALPQFTQFPQFQTFALGANASEGTARQGSRVARSARAAARAALAAMDASQALCNCLRLRGVLADLLAATTAGSK